MITEVMVTGVFVSLIYMRELNKYKKKLKESEYQNALLKTKNQAMENALDTQTEQIKIMQITIIKMKRTLKKHDIRKLV